MNTTNEIYNIFTNNQTDLTQAYQQALQETAFSNHFRIRPTQLRRVAQEETEALLAYLQEPDLEKPIKRGEALGQIGLGQDAVLKLGQASRLVCLDNCQTELLRTSITLIDDYHQAELQSFLNLHQDNVLAEQENLRTSLEFTISRYTNQIELAADIGRISKSTMVLSKIVQTIASLIQQRLNLDAVGIFFVDDAVENVHLQTSCQNPECGHEFPTSLQITSGSSIQQVIEQETPLIVANPTDMELPIQAILPLKSGLKMIGVIMLHSHQVNHLIEKDITALGIIADQVANVIENNQLLTSSQISLQQRETQLQTLMTYLPITLFRVNNQGKFTLIEGQSIQTEATDKIKLDDEILSTFSHSPKFMQSFGRALLGENATVIYEQDKQVLDVRFLPVRNEAGQVIEIMGLAVNITDQYLAEKERETLQQKLIEMQNQQIKQLSTPIIPIMERIIILPIIGRVDSQRAQDIIRSVLHGIAQHRAKIVIMDVTGMSAFDDNTLTYLDKTIHASRLKGAQTIITGLSDAMVETIVDLGFDWYNVETLSNLQTGLYLAMEKLKIYN